MKTIIRFPDGQQIIGEPESLFEVIVVSQSYYVIELYAFCLDSLKGEYKGIEEFIESNGEHPKFKENFSFEKKECEQAYYLFNSKLYLEEYMKGIVDFINNAFKRNQLSKQKYNVFMKSLKPIQKDIDKINKAFAKSS